MNARKIINDNKKQTPPAVRTAAFEALEQRQLMSVSWNAGALTINGSNGNDTIVVDCQDFGPGTSMIRVHENGAVTQNWTPYVNAKGLTVYGNAGNDTIDLSAVKFSAVIFGGANNDTIKGTKAADALYGSDGNDTVYGNGGDDVVDGGANDDTLVGGGGADALWGGPGIDTASYAERTKPVYAVIDGFANDGEVGEFDNVHTDVENLAGGLGNDILTGSSADNRIEGNGGSDILHGGAGKDVLFGGMAFVGAAKNNTGIDTMYGDGGDDQLWAPSNGCGLMHGGADNDMFFGSKNSDDLYGDGGSDTLYGGAGNDNLYAGMGSNDFLSGGDGNDVLVAIGGGTDSKLHGDGDTDTFWLDNYAAETTDVSDAESKAHHEHRVAGFEAYRMPSVQGNQVVFNEIAVGIDPKGENLTDPVAEAGSAKWKNFSNQPLFAPNGPSPDDIDQNGLGDCWYLSSLSSVARKNSDAIRQRVVPMGDGTFAVRFGTGLDEKFIRVDGDLPVDSSGNLLYAGKGAAGSIWVAIMEKAEAFGHYNLGSYESINGGTAFDAFKELGGTEVGFQSWQTKGMGEASLLDIIDGLIQDGNVVGFGTMDTAQQTQGFAVENHVYSVVKVNRDQNGKAVSVTLRNPWASDGVNPSGADDGYVTLTAHQAWVAMQDLEFAKF